MRCGPVEETADGDRLEYKLTSLYLRHLHWCYGTLQIQYELGGLPSTPRVQYQR